MAAAAPQLTEVPATAVGADAERIYGEVMVAVNASNASAAAAFGGWCQTFGQCPAEDNATKAGEFQAFLQTSFGDEFIAAQGAPLSRLIPDEEKRKQLVLAFGLYTDPDAPKARVIRDPNESALLAWGKATAGLGVAAAFGLGSILKTTAKATATGLATTATVTKDLAVKAAVATKEGAVAGSAAYGEKRTKWKEDAAIRATEQERQAREDEACGNKAAQDDYLERKAAWNQTTKPEYVTMDQRPIMEIKMDLKEKDLDIWKDNATRQAALQRCVQYVEGLCEPGVVALKGWHVRAVNEFGMEQHRVLVLTSTHFFRVQYDEQYGRIGKYTKTPMDEVLNIVTVAERPDAMKVYTSVDPGEGQKSVMGWMASAITGAGASRGDTDFGELYDRVYLVDIPQGTGLDAGTISNEMVRAFQEVHRRFVTVMEEVATISADEVKALKTTGKLEYAATYKEEAIPDFGPTSVEAEPGCAVVPLGVGPPVTAACVGAAFGEAAPLGGEVQFMAGSENVGAYLTWAQGVSRGGVVLVGDIYGFALPQTRSFADMLAQNGFTVMVPDFFAGQPWQPGADTSDPAFGTWAAQWAEPRTDGLLQEAARYLESECSESKVGVLGFCWGGKVAVRCATMPQGPAGPQWAACTSLYATRVEDLLMDLQEEAKAPLMSIWGEDDEHIPKGTLEKFNEACCKAPKCTFLNRVYPGAGHGFAHKGGDTEVAQQARAACVQWLQTQFAADAAAPAEEGGAAAAAPPAAPDDLLGAVAAASPDI